MKSTSSAYLKRSVLWVGLVVALVGITAAVLRATSHEETWPPPVKETNAEQASVLTPGDAMETFSLPPGFEVELVASEPLVQDPVAIDIDPEGRMWVVEMRGYMRNVIESEDDYQRHGQIVVLEDGDDDGQMDRKTVFMDSLVLPRSVLATEKGVLVGDPPHLWLAQDTDGDLKADTKEALRDDYGDRMANPEALPSDLMWGLDNWIHTTHYSSRFRSTADGWTRDSTLALGQWGITKGNHGQIYRTYNADPLLKSAVDPSYYLRNANLVGADGASISLTDDESQQVWPAHTTEGVNRGYREGVLRENKTLKTFTAASGGAAYRGGQYPADFQGDVFVPEPAGNLVRRFKLVEGEEGTAEAVNAYDRAEFMTSTDERFRPVNLTSAPDGSLYIVDMYRGVIQHRNFLSQYLKDYVREHGLEAPVGLGRIYRVTYTPNAGSRERPRLSEASNPELVEHLADSNGWWRDTAQQLLVERQATDVGPALRKMARSSEYELARLHALWTLEGIDSLSLDTVLGALEDRSAPVRAAALRMSEPWLREGNARAFEHASALVQDSSAAVRLQLAASLGEVPPPTADAAMMQLLAQSGTQPYLVDAAVSGLGGRELEFMQRLVKKGGGGAGQDEGTLQALQTLAATVINAGQPEEIDQVLALVSDRAGLQQKQRLALLDGIAELIPEARGGLKRPLKLTEEPPALAQATQASDSAVRRRASQVADRLTWPGKPGYNTEETTLLTAEAKQRYEQGEQEYQRVCATCHMADGQGSENLGAPLVGSEWVHGQQKDLARILLDGKEGEIGVMPPHRKQLSDEEIASVLTYIRNAWGNEASPIAPSTVKDVRQATASRNAPWTEEELRIIDH